MNKITIGLVAEPGSTRRNKTGSWRVFKPVVDPEKCVKCGICEIFCPEGIVHYSEEVDAYVPDYDYCKGCGVCAQECPKKAITMVLEEK